MRKKWIKRVVKVGVLCIAFVVALIITCYLIVMYNATGKTYDNVKDIPHNKVGILLATSPVTPGGAHNYYFDNRIKAAVMLYNAGKIDYIIASGGDYTNSEEHGCNEPNEIRLALYKQGVPYERIILDYDGTRTLNSILKAKQAYELDSVTIISQKDHNERAIYIADHNGINAIGYNAMPSPIMRKRIKNTVREYLARVKMFLDFLLSSKKSYSPHVQARMKFNNSPTLTELFYGMEKDSIGNYYDARVDTITGLSHYEFSDTWYHFGDSIQFDVSAGLYIDDEFPSEIVKEVIFAKLNKAIPEAFEYDLSTDQQSELLKLGAKPNQSTFKFVKEWEQIFHQLTLLNHGIKSLPIFPNAIGSRGCTICHKIYEDDTWTTYILEESVDYHSSCGCPSVADYYTIRKQDGHILSLDDVLTDNNKEHVGITAYENYCMEARNNGFAPIKCTPQHLMSILDGIAIVKEGILLYFYPYHFGCGAEGQYNLIITPKILLIRV